MIIAIDGLGVNGKSTLANMISQELVYKNFNTGAVYRCIALEIINRKLDVEKIEEVVEELKDIKIDFIKDRVILNGNDVTKEIRTEQISVKSTEWGTMFPIKELVRRIQRDFIKENDTVIEGRDICTRIAPNADVKFYLYSDFETRVKRLWNTEQSMDINEVKNNLIHRDKIDIEGGNFIKPVDAIEINTTQLSIDQVYNIMIHHINNALSK